MKRIITAAILTALAAVMIIAIVLPIAADTVELTLSTSYIDNWAICFFGQEPQNLGDYNVRIFQELDDIAVLIGNTYWGLNDVYVVVGNRYTHAETLENLTTNNFLLLSNGCQITTTAISNADDSAYVTNAPIVIYYKSLNMEVGNNANGWYNNTNNPSYIDILTDSYKEEAYNFGYDRGVADGFIQGADATEETAYNQGYSDGYGIGYGTAADAIEQGEFGTSFLAEVFAAPLKALNSVTLIETEMGNITLGGVVFACFGFGLFVLFLKMFAGG